MAASFEFAVVVQADQVEPARRTLVELTEDLQVWLPEARVVVISTSLSVAILNGAGEAIDLGTLPFTLYDRLTAFFGYGYYVLPGGNLPGVPVRAAWTGH